MKLFYKYYNNIFNSICNCGAFMSNKKYNLEIVKEIFKNNNCKLLEDKYINSDMKMRYKCSCGNVSTISLYNLKRGQRCKKCSAKRSKFNYDYVRDFFLDKKCELLSKEYKGSKQKLKYKCSCGNISEIEFRQFKQGQRCKKCSSRRACLTNKKNYNGKLYLQTKDFLKRREKTNLKKYKVKNPLQSDIIKKKREKTNLKRYGYKEIFLIPSIQKQIKKTRMEKYGYEFLLQSPKLKEKFKQTLLSRYGVPSLSYLSNCASKESQKLFKEIYNNLNREQRTKTYFASLNKEFTIKYGKNYYKYDFVNSLLKKTIEYNGYNFHPKQDQKENEIGWCAFHPNKTVKEAREYEKIKYEGIKKRGYKILTVWDYELHQDFNILVKKCLKFLMN